MAEGQTEACQNGQKLFRKISQMPHLDTFPTSCIWIDQKVRRAISTISEDRNFSSNIQEGDGADVMNRLISRGVSLSKNKNRGLTPLLYATSFASEKAMAKVLEAGSDHGEVDKDRKRSLHFIASRESCQYVHLIELSIFTNS